MHYTESIKALTSTFEHDNIDEQIVAKFLIVMILVQDSDF